MPSLLSVPIVHDQPSRRRRLPRVASTVALMVLGAMLAGCAGSVSELGDNMTEAFADPAKYEFYSCKQLQDERKGINVHIDELKRLMAKAETGVGGPVVAEMVYRQDYISYRGQLKFVDENWRRNKCVEEPDAPAAPVVLSGKGKGKGKVQSQNGPGAPRPGNAVN